MDDLKNDGVVVLNNNPTAEGATIIVVGVARSGTSMVGAVLDALGVHLGDKADNAVFEDLEISSAIERNETSRLKQLIETKNSRYSTWGFKRPEAFLRLPTLLPLFRSPRIVMTFRDPVAIAKRNTISMEMDFVSMLAHAMRRTADLVEFAQKIDCPALLASYEKALSQPGGFVNSVVSFCGLTPTDQQMKQAISSVQNAPAAYLNSSRVWTEGYFEGVRDNVARGWARRMPAKSVCNIEIWADGIKIASGPANRPRPDLDAQIGSFAFSIPIPDRDFGSLEARVAGTNISLKKTRNFT